MKILPIFILLLAPLASLHAATVTDQRCEYRENPLGIDVENPGLSWKIEERIQESGVRSQKTGSEICDLKSVITRNVEQTAYQVLVASSEALLNQDQGDLWDSGKVESDQSIHVEYQGKPLLR